MKIYFKGRDDGIGNRLEELIRLDYFAEKNSYKIIYFWNNTGKYKSNYKILGPIEYPNRFICKNIEITEDLSLFKGKTFDSTNYWREYISQDRYPHNLGNIDFNFSLDVSQKEYLAVHIRGKDRLVEVMDEKLKYIGLSDKKTYKYSTDMTVDYINNQNEFKYIYIAGDNREEIEKLKKRLRNNLQFVKFDNNKNIEGEYIDLYMLANAGKIVMSSLYSTFAIATSILQNKPIVTFFHNFETEINRFPLNLIYKGDNELKQHSIELKSIYHPFKVNKLIKLGKTFGDDFIIDEKSLLKSKYLISSSNRNNIYFEEHFNFIKKIKIIILNKKLRIRYDIIHGFRIILNELNRRQKLKKLMNQITRKIKLVNLKFSFLNKIVFFYFKENKVNFYLKYLNNIFLFLQLDVNNIKLLETLKANSSKISGLVLHINDFSSIEDKIDNFIIKFPLKICYVKPIEVDGRLDLIISFTKETLDETIKNLPVSFDNTNFNNKEYKVKFSD